MKGEAMIFHAPFTEEQVKNINEYQTDGMMHPFTCPCDHDDFVEGQSSAEHLLIAKKEYLYCSDCDYQQFWVHDFMANGEANAQLAKLVEEKKDDQHAQAGGTDSPASPDTEGP